MLTPKERILTAISHKEPDRVPVGEWQFGEELIQPVSGKKPLFFNGLYTMQALWDGRRDEIFDEWKKGIVEIVLKLGWDAVLVHLVADKDARVDVPERIDESNWKYSNGAVIRYSKETNRFFTVQGGTAAKDNTGKAPDEPTDSQMEIVRHVIKELGKTHFVFSAPLAGGGALSGAAPVGPVVNEVENWVRLYEDPDRYLEQHMAGMANPLTEKGLEISRREGIDGIAYGCDYGMTTGPFMSPAMFRKAILPPLAKYVEMVHNKGMIFLHHACGNNQVLMDMIVDAGVDVYQSIQTEMDIIKMKKRYGNNITLWGGVPAGDLVTSTPEKVYREAKKYLEECKPGGGYIFGTSHSVMPDAKCENYMAMLDAHRKFGEYEKKE